MILVIKKCDDCPFCCVMKDFRHCSVSVIDRRPIMHDVTGRPDWCPLIKEKIIVQHCCPAKGL